jgi:hypothetical protein
VCWPQAAHYVAEANRATPTRLVQLKAETVTADYLSMRQQRGSGKCRSMISLPRGSPFQQFHQNQTGKMIGLFCVIGIFKGHIADRCYELSQGCIDPVIATVCFHLDYPFDQKTLLIVASFTTRLTCDVLELFLGLLPVHHVPPIGNVFGALVVVLEIISMFPNIER